MAILITEKKCSGIRVALQEAGKEIAHAYVYFIHNDRHPEPYALLENVLVVEEYRGKGKGTELLVAAIAEAKKKGCYKFVCTSRSENVIAHGLYRKLGLSEQGVEFRLDLSS